MLCSICPLHIIGSQLINQLQFPDGLLNQPKAMQTPTRKHDRALLSKSLVKETQYSVPTVHRGLKSWDLQLQREHVQTRVNQIFQQWYMAWQYFFCDVHTLINKHLEQRKCTFQSHDCTRKIFSFFFFFFHHNTRLRAILKELATCSSDCFGNWLFGYITSVIACYWKVKMPKPKLQWSCNYLKSEYEHL